MKMNYPQELPAALARDIRDRIQESVQDLSEDDAAKIGLTQPDYIRATKVDNKTGQAKPLLDEDGFQIWQAIGTTWSKTVQPVAQKNKPQAVPDPNASTLLLLRGICKVVLDEFLYLNSSDIGVQKTEGENPQWSLNMSDAKITGLATGVITPGNTEAVTGGAVYNHVHPLPRIAQAEIDSATPPTELVISVSGALVVQVYQWDEMVSAWRLVNPAPLQVTIYADRVSITGFTVAGRYRATALYSLA
jgi:hypothetical protein